MNFGSLLLTLAAAHAAAPTLPPLLQSVEAEYAKKGTLTAEFDQVTETKAFNKVKRSRGKIFMQRPNRVRWETLSPEASTLVSDGNKYWLYTPPFDEGENGQLIEKNAKEIQNPLANAILAGNLSTSPGLKVKSVGKNQFEVLPRAGSAGSVKRAVVEIDPTEKTIRKLVLEHKDGNRAEITLTKIQLGTPFAADFFTFTPPPHTDRVKE